MHYRNRVEPRTFGGAAHRDLDTEFVCLGYQHRFHGLRYCRVSASAKLLNSFVQYVTTWRVQWLLD